MNSTESDEAYVSAVESGKDTPGPTYQVALELCGAWRRLRKSNAEKDKQIAVMVEALERIAGVRTGRTETQSDTIGYMLWNAEQALVDATASEHTYDEMMARERGKWCEDFLKVCEDIVVEVPQLPSSWIGFVKDAIERMVEAEKGRGCE